MISIHTLYVIACLSGCSSSDVQDVELGKAQETTVHVNDIRQNDADINPDQEIEKQESQKILTSEDSRPKDNRSKKDRAQDIDQDIDQDLDKKDKNDKQTEKKIKKDSSIEMGDMELFANLDIHFSGVAPIFQNYFYNEKAQESYLAFLHRGANLNIRNLPVYVRWDDVGHSMGRGEICVYSADPLAQEHMQSYSQALYAYRTYLGSYFDVRLMSFSMCIESSNCRFEVLDRSDISGVTSCVTILSDQESGSLRPLNSKAKGEKVCTSSFDKEQRSKIPISYDSPEEQFTEIWSQIEGCFLK